MERVTFLVARTGGRVSCLLNPETLVMRRTAGVRPRAGRDAPLTGDGMTDAPLLYTGGGATTLEMDLLFDVGLAGSSPAADDVRQLTGPLWQLAENAADAAAGRSGRGRPPVAHFVWGKSWSVPGVVTAVSERLEMFSPGGAPQRSWLRMRFRRVDEGEPAAASPAGRGVVDPAALVPDDAVPDMAVQEMAGEGTADGGGPPPAAERLDQLADRWYGDPAYWRLLARANDIADPLDLESGRVLRVPSAALPPLPPPAAGGDK